MNFFNSVINFFKDGGVFLYPLALIFVVGVSIAIERYVYLTRETIRNRSLWEALVPALSSGNFKQVVALTQNSKASIATILNYGVARVASARRRDDIEKAMDESLLEVIPRIEKRTHYLSSLANVGLLIGLLGTITGLIGAFSAVATANPAAKGSVVVLFATGEGQTNPAGVDGKLASSQPLPAPVVPVTVLVGGPQGAGKNASVLYAGAAPTLVKSS